MNPTELYVFAYETNLSWTKFINQYKSQNIFTLRSHIGVKFFSYRQSGTLKS